MNLDACLKALDGLQAAYHNTADVEMGLKGLIQAGMSMPVLVRLADARGHDKIAMVGRRMIRDVARLAAQTISDAIDKEYPQLKERAHEDPK